MFGIFIVNIKLEGLKGFECAAIVFRRNGGLFIKYINLNNYEQLLITLDVEARNVSSVRELSKNRILIDLGATYKVLRLDQLGALDFM